jgi:malyl-CoA/(S)-citramalyl-CoA lyase
LREQEGRPARSLRINGLDTHRCYRDTVDVIEQAGDRVDTVLVPKVSCAGDVHLVATLLSQIEAAHRLPAQDRDQRADRDGRRHAQRREIAAAYPERMEAMVFDYADYAASLQSHTAGSA